MHDLTIYIQFSNLYNFLKINSTTRYKDSKVFWTSLATISHKVHRKILASVRDILLQQTAPFEMKYMSEYSVIQSVESVDLPTNYVAEGLGSSSS